jgi:hypothetical protein
MEFMVFMVFSNGGIGSSGWVEAVADDGAEICEV